MKMHILVASIVLIVVVVVSATGHSHHVHHDHDHHGHGQGKAVSYAVVTKHDDHHHSHGEHQHKAHHGHVAYHGHMVKHHDHGHGGHDHHGHAKYDFTYGVKDPKAGDMKKQWESRNGDSVKGGYALKEADGTMRIVKYTADKKKGFEATVHKVGKAHHDYNHQTQKKHHGSTSGFVVHHDHGHAASFAAHHGQGHKVADNGHQKQHQGHATSYIVIKKAVQKH